MTIRDTYWYWDMWSKKNKRVEEHFVKKWEKQFEEIRQFCKNIEKPENLQDPGFDHEEPYYTEYYGTVMSMTPSGKYYMPFANSNVSTKEEAIDEFWHEKLEEIVDEEGCWYESGEGSATDIFICKVYVKPKRNIQDMTSEEQITLLEEIVGGLSTADILAIPGIMEIMLEYYNNDILTMYEEGGES